MKLIKNVRLMYLVESVEQATYLENAIKALPARVELSDFIESENKPALYVMGKDGFILIRPYNCRISNVKFGRDVYDTNDSKDMKSGKYRGSEYHFYDLQITIE